MRRPFIAGNWKMNNTVADALELVKGLRDRLALVRDVDIVVGPTFTALHAVARKLEGSRIAVAGQDAHWAPSGAYTGNISVPMLKDVGCEYVILGHSERRQYHGEDDALVNKKVHAVLDGGLTPILCCGETLEEREAGEAMERIRTQITGGLEGLSADQVAKLVIAYEPIWAIGTGRTASTAQAQEIHAYIRGLLRESFGADTAAATRILYGGSVKPANVDALMAQDDIDGALVGGAALKVDSFVRIVKFERTEA